MKREIKFRFWSGTKMFYDIENVLECLKQQTYHNEGFKPPHGFDHVGEENSEFMQFTGLKDKNGKEIYEGDIVRFLNGETTSNESGMECDEFLTDGVIYWEYESAQWDITGRIDVSREDAFTDLSEYEVVGNRFENPELLDFNITE